MISVYGQLACRCLRHKPSVTMPLLTTRLVVAISTTEHHCHWPLPSYTAWWKRHVL